MAGRYTRVLGVMLALLVGALAVAAPWCIQPVCAKMSARTAAAMTSACEPDAGTALAAACNDMRALSGPATAAAPSTAKVALDLSAVTVASIAVPAVRAVSAVIEPPLDDPPRLALDTSRLRI